MLTFVNWSVTQSGGALRIEGQHQASDEADVLRNVHRIDYEAGFWRAKRYAYDRQGRKLARLL
jgi:hypothetical protein